MEIMGTTLAVAASALRAERQRMDVIASNLANSNTTETAAGGPYRRRNVIFSAQAIGSDFGDTLVALADQPQGVQVTDVIEDQAPPRQVFDPGHPDANPEGYVAYPNINPVTEMVDLQTATRAYEANVQVVNATKRMAEAALAIGA
jgi:flagellar basal-body rod protein FlgC